MQGNQLLITTHCVELLQRLLVTLHRRFAREGDVGVAELSDAALELSFCHHFWPPTETVVRTPAL